ncbi:MAG: MgtC/SapB family protein [Pyrinomonadaceae bacterium]
MNELSPNLVIVIKLLLSMLCGGAIGLERELSHKPAGLRTNVLIALAATLLMIASRHVSGGAPYTDPARLVAQVISGIGFIGAGVIMQSRGSVRGLTTAATIFIVTAVGISIGEGMFGAALLTTMLVIFVLVLLRRVEQFILRRHRLFHYSFKTKDSASALTNLLELLERENVRLENFNVKGSGEEGHEVGFSVVTSLDGNSRLIKSLPQLGTEVTNSTREESD